MDRERGIQFDPALVEKFTSYKSVSASESGQGILAWRGARVSSSIGNGVVPSGDGGGPVIDC